MGIDITKDTGKLTEALRDLPDPGQVEQAAQDLEKMNNPELAGRFRRALQRIAGGNDDSVAYLQTTTGLDPSVALQRAYSGYRQREGDAPRWVIVGAGVDLSEEAVSALGLERRVDGAVRPGYVLVGVSAETD